MKKISGSILLVTAIIITTVLLYDFFTVSKVESRQIAERYIASQSFKWNVGGISRERDFWVVYLSPVDAVKEITWLYIDRRSGEIQKITETE
ncbi:hypothetical protein AB4Z50_14625 [Paenibacillus sp. 2TAB26]|uniref:hypothetical protein n=1 Tax=Paenibacillus sp. 2TAB26 TaxID=3233005 RepID=UPI003F95C0FC